MLKFWNLKIWHQNFSFAQYIFFIENHSFCYFRTVNHSGVPQKIPTKNVRTWFREAKFKRALRYTFWLILQKTFAAFSHHKLKVAQIWSTHQSKALIFYFGMKKFGVRFLKILWETDKVHFTSSNLVCVYTHPKFQNMKFSLSVVDKIFKNSTPNFFMPK